jgi:hypothetical protein
MTTDPEDRQPGEDPMIYAARICPPFAAWCNEQFRAAMAARGMTVGDGIAAGLEMACPDKAEMDANEAMRLIALAGLTAEELAYDPEIGVLISATGARKLAAIAPDPRRAQALLDLVATVLRRKLRVVEGGKHPAAAQ